MIGFSAGAVSGGAITVGRSCIRVKVDTVGNTQSLAFTDITLPLLVILAFDILPIPAAKNSEINAICLYFFPIDCAIMNAHVNALPSGIGNNFATTIHITSSRFRPGRSRRAAKRRGRARCDTIAHIATVFAIRQHAIVTVPPALGTIGCLLLAIHRIRIRPRIR